MKKPGYLKDAIATERGYVSPKGELLKAAKLSAEAIAEWNGVPCCEEVIVVEDNVSTLEGLTKAELVEIAEAKEIEINKRDSKKKILGKLFSVFKA